MSRFPRLRRRTPSTQADRNFPDDFMHENGNYHNTCTTCRRGFVGHKRRVTCRACANVGTPSIGMLLDDAINALLGRRPGGA